jgi:hypothetical protein
VLEVERREHHFVPGFDPELTDRAADAARSDDPDFHFSGCLPRGVRCERQAAQGEAGRGSPGSPGSAENPAATLLHGIIRFHERSPD